uniref:Disease resistance protein RGA2 n=1 Tax=Rhizophora mucronata TaxID=61149 RepID=A0A2P2JIW2_RHIMU
MLLQRMEGALTFSNILFRRQRLFWVRKERKHNPLPLKLLWAEKMMRRRLDDFFCQRAMKIM